MCHLALISMALMLCMPVINRWQQMQVQDGQDNADMCLSEASRTALETNAPDADGHAHGHGHLADGDVPAHDQHMDHGAACGYCTLATRLLPVLALALVVPLPLPAQYFGIPALPAAPAAQFWPAHTPRGPPLLS